MGCRGFCGVQSFVWGAELSESPWQSPTGAVPWRGPLQLGPAALGLVVSHQGMVPPWSRCTFWVKMRGEKSKLLKSFFFPRAEGSVSSFKHSP